MDCYLYYGLPSIVATIQGITGACFGRQIGIMLLYPSAYLGSLDY
jgi:hypothetical protein